MNRRREGLDGMRRSPAPGRPAAFLRGLGTLTRHPPRHKALLLHTRGLWRVPYRVVLFTIFFSS